MKATIYRANGITEEATPANGKSFSLTELQKVVGGYIENVYLNNGKVMVVNEEGKLYGLPVNEAATSILRSHFKTNDFIVGDVIIY